MKIYLDAGHGSADSGAVGLGGRLEKTDNLSLAVKLAELFKLRGHSVKLSRSQDTYPSLKQRADEANAFCADLFISLHRNSAQPSANGVEVLYCPNASAKSKSLASSISKAISDECGFRNRGAKCQGAYVLSHTKMPAVTIESGFITNAEDNAKYDKYNDELASAVIAAAENEFGCAVKAAAKEEEDLLRYKTLEGAQLWILDGSPEEGTELNLLSYWWGDVYAKVADDAGGEYLVRWDKLKKA